MVKTLGQTRQSKHLLLKGSASATPFVKHPLSVIDLPMLRASTDAYPDQLSFGIDIDVSKPTAHIQHS